MTVWRNSGAYPDPDPGFAGMTKWGNSGAYPDPDPGFAGMTDTGSNATNGLTTDYCFSSLRNSHSAIALTPLLLRSLAPSHPRALAPPLPCTSAPQLLRTLAPLRLGSPAPSHPSSPRASAILAPLPENEYARRRSSFPGCFRSSF